MLEDPVETWIADRDPDTRALCERLHQLMLVHPGMSARLRYGIPFYDHRRWIAYINPLRRGGVECAFVHGRRLADPGGLLDARGRKMVAGLRIGSLAELEPREEALLGLVDEALALDGAGR